MNISNSSWMATLVNQCDWVALQWVMNHCKSLLTQCDGAAGSPWTSPPWPQFVGDQHRVQVHCLRERSQAFHHVLTGGSYTAGFGYLHSNVLVHLIVCFGTEVSDKRSIL